MAEFAIITDTVRTGTTGTKTFTNTGTSVGTPKGAIIIVTYAIANETAANNMELSYGFTDGTNQAVCSGSADNIGTMGTTSSSNAGFTDRCLHVANGTGTVQSLAAFSSFGTDTITLNFTAVSATAYIIKIILIGGTGVSNVTVGTSASPANIGDPPTTISSLTFESDLLFVAHRGVPSAAFGGATTSAFRVSLGFVQRTGSDPPAQYGMGTNYYSGNATTLNDHRANSGTCYGDPEDGPTDHALQIEQFSSTGFKAYTRGVTGAITFMYMAVKLSGISAKAVAVDSWTDTTGTKSITGAGFTPQFGMVIMGKAQAYNTRYLDANAEVLALGAFTADAQFCASVTSKDAVGPGSTTDDKSVVSTDPIFIYNQGATFHKATFAGFQSDGADFTATTANATTRKWAALFIQAMSSGPMFRGS
jgi:hypothetical protein